MKKCKHNARCRYIHGFYCEDCKTFFPKESPTYRKEELIDSIWMVLNNINVERLRAKKKPYKDVEYMQNKIGIGIKHKNYEEIISEAEKIMKKYKVNSDSATVTLK